MLDANAFDYILDRSLDPALVRRMGELFITTVQHGELLNVPDRRRRKRLIGVLSAIDPVVRPASAGVSLNESYRDGRAVRHDAPPDAARRFHAGARRPGRWKDATIGEIAQLEGCILVTDDRSFGRRASGLGVTVLSCAEAFAHLTPGLPTPDARRGA